jgi:hypothetical protein
MKHIQRKPIRFLLTSLALLVVAGCGEGVYGPSGAQDPGVLLVTLTQGGEDLAWTSDGTELVYAVAGELRAVSASTHTVRRLDTPPSVFIQAVSRAGARIYFASALSAPGPNDPNSLIGRVNPIAGSAEILLTSRSGPDLHVIVSADELMEFSTTSRLAHKPISRLGRRSASRLMAVNFSTIRRRTGFSSEHRV